MLKKVFECENKVCARHGIFTYEIKIEVKKLFMAAGNGEATASQPWTTTMQVCCPHCALAEIEDQFAKQKSFE